MSVYDAAQAQRGRRVYATHCASCPGTDLDGGVGPALAGAAFLHKWSEQGARSLFSVTGTSMPRPAMGSLSAEAGRQHVAVTSGGASMTFGGSGSPTVFVFALPPAR